MTAILSDPVKVHLPHILSTIQEVDEREMPVVKTDSGGRRPLPSTSDHRVSEYEHLIVAHYLEELRKAPPYTKKSHQAPASPYAQKLPHTNIVLTAPQVRSLIDRQKDSTERPVRKPRSRPQSAMSYSQAQKEHSAPAQKPKIDPKFIADPDKWDPLTPRPETETKTRPQSAPMGSSPNRRRPLSAYRAHQRTNRPSSAQRPSSAKSKSELIDEFNDTNLLTQDSD